MATLTFVRSYDEVSNIKTFVFEKADLTWTPGQYQAYTFPQLGDDSNVNEHWFTIASAPIEGEIHISTRLSDSKFKTTLNALKEGNTIDVHGLGGDFTWEDDNKVVFVAGGIGVTPFRSMIVERAKTGKSIPATLLYYGRDENFAFRSEFDAIAAEHPEFTVKYLAGVSVTADGIVAEAGASEGTTVYISGPEPMVESIGEQLKSKGISLKQDWFPGYDSQNY